MKSSAPPIGPHSKSISGQCTAIFGSPGSAPSAISSMLGWVAAVSATESPSQLKPGVDPQDVDQGLFCFDCCLCWHVSQLSGAGLGPPRRSVNFSARFSSASFWVYSGEYVLSTDRWDIRQVCASVESSRTTPQYRHPLLRTAAKSRRRGLIDRANFATRFKIEVYVGQQIGLVDDHHARPQQTCGDT